MYELGMIIYMVFKVEDYMITEPQYTPMMGGRLCKTKDLTRLGYDGRIFEVTTRSGNRTATTQCKGILAYYNNNQGYIFNIENICNYKSLKGHPRGVLVFKPGIITPDITYNALIVHLYHKYSQMCFVTTCPNRV